MVKEHGGKEKKDFFIIVMIVQSVVCAILVVFMLISARSDGKFASLMKEGYLKFMTADFSGEDFSEAFKNISEYVAVFSEDDTQQAAEVFADEAEVEISETEPATGGVNFEFSSLEALEGVSLENIAVDFEMAEPLEEYEITSLFGYRVSPVSGETGIHTGLDMAAPYGTPIYAAADGTVVDSAWDNSYGYYIKLRHSDNTVSIYAHCSTLCADAGDEVEAGDKIAEVGSTGASTGNHLHFEVRKDNIRINPQYILFGI